MSFAVPAIGGNILFETSTVSSGTFTVPNIDTHTYKCYYKLIGGGGGGGN